jgi:hypothetical protein
VDAFEESGIAIKVLGETLPIRQWEVAGEFRRRIKRAFDEQGIEIPFPHSTVYWGAGVETRVRQLVENANLDKDSKATKSYRIRPRMKGEGRRTDKTQRFMLRSEATEVSGEIPPTPFSKGGDSHPRPLSQRERGD